MKKFTPTQKQHVDDLRGQAYKLQNTLREERREFQSLKKSNEELVNSSVKAQAELDGQLTESREMHRDLLNAVEDCMEAEYEKEKADRRFEGARGCLDTLHSEHGKRVQEPIVMGFNYAEPSGKWERNR
jgi:chromosome segregation ATPase